MCDCGMEVKAGDISCPRCGSLAEGYYGHEQGCDCAVCDDIAFRQSLQKGFMSIAEVHEHEKLLREELNESQEAAGRLYEDGRKMKAELDDALERVEKWKTWYESVSVDCEKWKQTALSQGEGLAQYIIAKDRYKEALEKIARGTLEPGHTYLQAVRMQDIAREALADRP